MSTQTPVRRRRAAAPSEDRTNLSSLERARGGTRVGLAIVTAAVIVVLAVVSVGPMLFLFKFATSTTPDIVQQPLSWWPSGFHPQNVVDAWTDIHVGRLLINTVIIAAGSVVCTLAVTLTGAFGLTILRPRYARVINTAVLATLFIPGVVSLISQYLTILNMPLLNLNLINTFAAVWLPAAANSFYVLLVSRFLSGLPMEIVEAARVDGAGPFTIFWRIIIPMSRPIIGVIALLSTVSSWKEFLWPLLVLPDQRLQPLSVGLYRIAGDAPQNLVMGGMLVAALVPLGLFLVFQRQFLRSAGQAGAIKG